MKYYVNEGNKIGKTYDAKDDFEAVAIATAYGHLKGWKELNIYCQSTKEYVTRFFPAMTFKRWLEVCEHVKEFLWLDKEQWNESPV